MNYTKHWGVMILAGVNMGDGVPALLAYEDKYGMPDYPTFERLLDYNPRHLPVTGNISKSLTDLEYSIFFSLK